VATTHAFLSFSLEPAELLRASGGEMAILKGEEGLFQSKPALCSCGGMGQLRIPWRLAQSGDSVRIVSSLVAGTIPHAKGEA
jgi:hypothetical protein